MALVLIERFHEVYEAELARALLDSHGIEAVVADTGLATIDPLMQRALGGTRLMAPASQADAARELLARAQRGELALAEGDDLPRREGGPGLAVATLAAVTMAPELALGVSGGKGRMSLVRIVGLALVALASLGFLLIFAANLLA